MNYILPVFLLLFCFSSPLLAQKPHQFTTGLILDAEVSYGREALIKDELAYQLFTGDFIAPTSADATFKTQSGESLPWKAVNADSTHTFRGDGISEGYIYLYYDSDKEQSALLNVAGHSMLFFNGIPYAGDIYKYGWLHSPVQLKKGRNEILVRASRFTRWNGLTAKLVFPENPISIYTADATLPHILVGEHQGTLTGAIVIINSTDQPLKGLSISSTINSKTITTEMASVPAMATRKVAFHFDAGTITKKDSISCLLQLIDRGKPIAESTVSIQALHPDEPHSRTFISEIDGSVQYYSVVPQTGGSQVNSALFLSVHGAEVEAISQARAYKPKDWGVIVAPTNRRPRGFNWEEWGRIDALEVLEIAKGHYKPDPQKIYLTGHSMGGHGTWFLGATYPEKWAAIAPCAGYPSLLAYGSADGKIPDPGTSETNNLLLQAGNGSNVLSLIRNYSSLGIYIHHGDSDRVVPVDYARQMRQELSTFHTDFSYYEYPGGSHWFGDESVDWPPIFDFFSHHSIPHDSSVHHLNFTTANPAVSSSHYWAQIHQQEKSLKMSKILLDRDMSHKTIKGSTENVAVLRLSLHNFKEGDTIQVLLDDQEAMDIVVDPNHRFVYLHHAGQWSLGTAPDTHHKGKLRNGTFKEPFNNRMVFVYGTKGDQEENAWAYQKAAYDAQVWYYRGNGAVDLIADKDFKPSKYPDRGVVIYGNAQTNLAWKQLLADSPIQVKKGLITVGDQVYNGTDIGAYFMWPRADSEVASIAVISGSGITGMKATVSNQYFAAGSGYPDFTIFSADMLINGYKSIKSTGFYNNEWKIDKKNLAAHSSL
ncbi:carboxylesterase family protein [Anditalea andensis]|uniref:Peptidase S9 prolyl oligopeptidase catalytic domain-containing protein n=1 Tax=Anditalea andensis TaxID=1048983 RepID=A0A074KZG7_9BACT|nr:alpha/beta hydrolase-fold protein [Anditalea andensis]KEO74314.1 hypothetical protein EL17_09295 [Anditalea andensis]